MKLIFNIMSAKIIPHVLVIFFVGTALATSSYAGVKLFYSLSTPSSNGIPQVPGAVTPTPEQGAQTGQTQTDETIALVNSGGALARGSTVNTTSNTITRTAIQTFPTAVPTKTTNTALVNTTSNNTGGNSATNNGCVVTLFGKQYDVTKLQNTHSGGNIFNCGTDMSSVYQGKHGTSMSRIQAYLISSSGNNNSGEFSNSTQNSSPTWAPSNNSNINSGINTSTNKPSPTTAPTLTPATNSGSDNTNSTSNTTVTKNDDSHEVVEKEESEEQKHYEEQKKESEKQETEEQDD